MGTSKSEMKACYNFIKWPETWVYPQPPVGIVLSYVAMFTNQDTAAKYVMALRWTHHYARLSTASFDNQSLAQALSGGRKLLPSKRTFTYARWDMAEKLVQRAKVEGEAEHAALYALSANFLPRLRYELLPLRIDDLETHSSVEVVQCGAAGQQIPALRISLKSRKIKGVPSSPDGASAWVIPSSIYCARCAFSTTTIKLEGSAPAGAFRIRTMHSPKCAGVIPRITPQWLFAEALRWSS